MSASTIVLLGAGGTVSQYLMLGIGADASSGGGGGGGGGTAPFSYVTLGLGGNASQFEMLGMASSTGGGTGGGGDVGPTVGTLTPFTRTTPLDGTQLECAVCGFRCGVKKLQKRWDGLYVCHDCYETRHILDLYKARTEKFIVHPGIPENDGPLWTPTVTNVNVTGTGTTTIIADYIDTGTEITFSVSISNTRDNQSFTSGVGCILTAPTAISAGVGGTMSIDGLYIGQLSFDALNDTIISPTWGSTKSTILIRGKYTK